MRLTTLTMTAIGLLSIGVLSAMAKDLPVNVTTGTSVTTAADHAAIMPVRWYRSGPAYGGYRYYNYYSYPSPYYGYSAPYYSYGTPEYYQYYYPQQPYQQYYYYTPDGSYYYYAPQPSTIYGY